MWPPKLQREEIKVGMRLAYMEAGSLACRKVLGFDGEEFILSKAWKDKNDPSHNDDINEIGGNVSLEEIQLMLAQDRADLPY